MGRGIGLLLLWLASSAQGSVVFDRNRCQHYLLWFQLQEQIVDHLRALSAGKFKAGEEAFRRADLIDLRKKAAEWEEKLGGVPDPFTDLPVGTETIFPSTLYSLEAIDSLVLEDAPSPPKKIIVSADGGWLGVMGENTALFHLWDLSKREYRPLRANFPVRDITVDWEDRVLVLESPGQIHRYGFDGTRLGVVPGDWKADALTISADRLVTAGGGIHFSAPARFEHEHSFPAPDPGRVSILEISTDQSAAAFIGAGALHILDLRTGARFKSFPQWGPKVVQAMAFEPASRRIAVLGMQGQLGIWDPKEPTKLLAYAFSGFRPECMAWDEKGRVILGGSSPDGVEGLIIAFDADLRDEVGRYVTEQQGGIGAITVVSADSGLWITGNAQRSEVSFHSNPLD